MTGVSEIEAGRRSAMHALMASILAETLAHIEVIDPSSPEHEPADFPDMDEQERYAQRNNGVVVCVGAAGSLGYPCGFVNDPDTPGYVIAFIELPTGQVSWHLPEFAAPWDGHDTATKYVRTQSYIRAVYRAVV